MWFFFATHEHLSSHTRAFWKKAITFLKYKNVCLGKQEYFLQHLKLQLFYYNCYINIWGKYICENYKRKKKHIAPETFCSICEWISHLLQNCGGTNSEASTTFEGRPITRLLLPLEKCLKAMRARLGFSTLLGISKWTLSKIELLRSVLSRPCFFFF
jgi:hypothetical protein